MADEPPSKARELFASQLRDALANFYSTTYLQTSPLATLLPLPQALDATVAQSLRQLLREAIESLRPSTLVPYGRPEWLGYRLLWVHYVQAHTRLETCQELAISRSTFYRYQREALEAVASILWERRRLKAPTVTQQATSADPPTSECAVREAVRLARDSGRRRVDLSSLIEGVSKTISPLAAEKGITVVVTAPGGDASGHLRRSWPTTPDRAEYPQ